MIKADIIIKGNNIFTGISEETISGFVAIKEDKIFYVGTNKEIELFIGLNTNIYSYDDELIMPGFHDDHVHIIDGALYEESVKLQNTKTQKEAAAKVKEFADTRRDDPWVLGYGWYHIYWDEKNYPTKDSLDELIPDRPVFLQNEDGHGAWVNSKALEICNITKDTKDPEFGTIFRDEAGEPTGYLDELAMELCAKEAYKIPKEREKTLLKKFMEKANRYGVTSVNDMQPLFSINIGNLENYKELEDEEQLTIRIHASTNLFESIDKIEELRIKFNSPKLKHAGLKQFIDGVSIPYTALLLEPYSDKGETKGFAIINEEELCKAVVLADKKDIPVHLHAAGDGSVRMALDCYEIARKHNNSDNARHTVEHVDNIHQNDLKRFKELNVIASMQPEHMAPTDTYEENPYIQRLGKERAQLMWPCKSLINENAVVAFGSDYPVVEINPLNGVYRAVTRLHDDNKPEGGLIPQQRVTVGEALSAYTKGSAYMVNRENEIGTLEVGKYADIVILNKDIFKIDSGQIKDTEVIMTIFDGKIVYQK